MPPTLLTKGAIIKSKWMNESFKNDIDNLPSIEVIMNYIRDRIWEDNNPPKIKLRGIGSKVLVLRSGTGSGKSTLLPPYLYNSFLENIGNLIITQPTKATTTDIPFQILQFNKQLKLGDNIGFQTGSISRKPIRGILFSTYGILLQHLKIMEDNQFMEKYKFIIIDEVHKRTVDIDSCLFYLKRLLNKYWNLPECPFIILTSATFEPKIFMDYFNCPEDHFLDVAGSSFPINDNYTILNMSDYIKYAVDLAEKIHLDNINDIIKNDTFRDILIFVQGSSQIKKILEKIHFLNAKIFSKGLKEAKKHSKEQFDNYITGGNDSDIYYVAPVAAISEKLQEGGKEYKDLFSDIKSVSVDIYEFDEKGEITDVVIKTVKASRRIIIGTNAIETGLTIDTLKYCIDTGFAKESSFNPNFGCNMLLDQNVTQASARQRRGRVGRKDPGIFYGVYTKDIYDDMPELPYPDIVKEDITQFILGVIISETETEIKEIDYMHRKKTSFQLNKFDQNWYEISTNKSFNASNLDFIQYPSADSIGYATEKLYGLGFIDYQYKPTLFGIYGNKFRKVSLENIRMILAGYNNGANILDLITISCCLQIGFQIGINKKKYKPMNPLSVSKEESLYYYKILFRDEFIEYIFIWDEFMKIIEQVGNQIKNNDWKNINIEILNNWAKENNFKLNGLFEVIYLRDEILGDMLTMGLNPYYNGLGLDRGTYNLVDILRRNLQEGMEEIKKIKKCIYEGYRFNVCIWNNISKKYVNYYNNININIESNLLQPLNKEIDDEDIKQVRPHIIIVSNISLKKSNIRSGMYEFSGDYISVLDGFVDIDTNFLYN